MQIFSVLISCDGVCFREFRATCQTLLCALSSERLRCGVYVTLTFMSRSRSLASESAVCDADRRLNQLNVNLSGRSSHVYCALLFCTERRIQDGIVFVWNVKATVSFQIALSVSVIQPPWVGGGGQSDQQSISKQFSKYESLFGDRIRRRITFRHKNEVL